MNYGKNGLMKYLEELRYGDIFIYKKDRYILSSDHKKYDQKTKHMAISIKDGTIKWFLSDDLVEAIEIYYRNDEGNILLVKDYDSTKN